MLLCNGLNSFLLDRGHLSLRQACTGIIHPTLFLFFLISFSFSNPARAFLTPCNHPVPNDSTFESHCGTNYLHFNYICDIDKQISITAAEKIDSVLSKFDIFNQKYVRIGIAVLRNVELPNWDDMNADETVSESISHPKNIAQRTSHQNEQPHLTRTATKRDEFMDFHSTEGEASPDEHYNAHLGGATSDRAGSEPDSHLEGEGPKQESHLGRVGPELDSHLEGEGPKQESHLGRVGPELDSHLEGEGPKQESHLGRVGPELDSHLEGEGPKQESHLGRVGPELDSHLEGEGPKQESHLGRVGPELDSHLEGEGPEHDSQSGGAGPEQGSHLGGTGAGMGAGLEQDSHLEGVTSKRDHHSTRTVSQPNELGGSDSNSYLNLDKAMESESDSDLGNPAWRCLTVSEIEYYQSFDSGSNSNISLVNYYLETFANSLRTRWFGGECAIDVFFLAITESIMDHASGLDLISSPRIQVSFSPELSQLLPSNYGDILQSELSVLSAKRWTPELLIASAVEKMSAELNMQKLIDKRLPKIVVDGSGQARVVTTVIVQHTIPLWAIYTFIGCVGSVGFALSLEWTIVRRKTLSIRGSGGSRVSSAERHRSSKSENVQVHLYF